MDNKTENTEDTASVISPDTGEVLQIPKSSLNVYLGTGFQLDTPELQAQRAEEENYTSTGQQIGTVAEGLAARSYRWIITFCRDRLRTSYTRRNTKKKTI